MTEPALSASNAEPVDERKTLMVAVDCHFVEVGGSFYAGPPLEANFGLGRTTTIDSVRIDWPKSPTQMLTNVPVDAILVVTEP